MKLRNKTLVILVFCTFSLCRLKGQVNIKQQYTIHGNITMDSGHVYLESYDFNFKSPSIIDSTEIVDKKFKIQLVNKKIHSCLIIIKGYPYRNIFYLDNKNIYIDIDTSTNKFLVKGGKENVLYESYLNNFEKLYLPIKNLRKKKDTITSFKEKLSIEDSITHFDSILFLVLKRTILKNKNHISTLLPISEFENNKHGNEGLTLLNKMPPSIKKTIDWLNVERSFNIFLTKKITKNKIAPDFMLSDSSNQIISLHNFKGKIILLDFWASWCEPCIREFPDLKEIAKKNIPNGLVMISISVDKYSNLNKWKKALNQYDLNWINLIDNKNKEVEKKYEVDAIPKQILIDRNGKIHSVNMEEGHLEEEIEKLLRR